VTGGAVIHKLAPPGLGRQPLRSLMNNCETDISFRGLLTVEIAGWPQPLLVSGTDIGEFAIKCQ